MFAKIMLSGSSNKQIDIKSLMQGDVLAHNHLYREAFEPLYSQVIEVLKDPGRVSTVVTHAFVKYWLRSDNLPTIDEVTAYLYVTCRSVCLAIAKNETSDDSPNELLLKEILVDKVRDGLSRQSLLSKLNGETAGEITVAKEIFGWRYERNMPVEEIAGVIDSPVEFIEQMENLAKKILHLILSVQPNDKS